MNKGGIEISQDLPSSSYGKTLEMRFKTVCSAIILLMWMYPIIGSLNRIHPSTVCAAESTGSNKSIRHDVNRQKKGITIRPLNIEGETTTDPFPIHSDRAPARVSTKRTPSRSPAKKASLEEHPPSVKFHSYVAEPGDTLKTISQKFYGSALYFPVILLHNSQVHDFDVEEGMEIRLLQDAVEAIRLFRKHTVVDEGRIFWIYTAQKNDTLEEIGRKFYRTRYQNNPLVNLNPESRIREGEHIRILLN